MGKTLTVKQKRAGKRRLRRKIEKAMAIIEREQPMLADKAHIAYSVPGSTTKKLEDTKTAVMHGILVNTDPGVVPEIYAVKELKDVPGTAVILGIVFTDKPTVGTPGYYFYEG